MFLLRRAKASAGNRQLAIESGLTTVTYVTGFGASIKLKKYKRLVPCSTSRLPIVNFFLHQCGGFYFSSMNGEAVRTICLALPAATETIKWGADLVFSVGDKMFCVTSFEEPFKCSFKVANEAFEEMSCREGFIPAPYLTRAKWVLVSNDAKLLRNP